MFDELTDALVRGDSAPVITGAEFIQQPRIVHGGTTRPPAHVGTPRNLYGGRR